MWGQSCVFSTLFIYCDSYIAKAALYFIFSISLLSHSTPRLEYTLSVISEMEWKHIASFSGSLAANGNNAKNTSPIMEEINFSKHYKGDNYYKKGYCYYDWDCFCILLLYAV